MSFSQLDALEVPLQDPEEPSQAEEELEEVNAEERESNQATKKRYIKAAIGTIWLGLIIYVIIDSGNIKKGLGTFLDWFKNHPIAGFFSFVIVYFFATLVFIPGSVLTLGAGFIFSAAFGMGPGVAIGTLCVFLGSCMGAIAAFLLGRYLLQDQVTVLSQKYAIFQALNAALEENGLYIFILLRLSPIVPFTATNYLGGISAVKFSSFVLALFAMLPGSVLYIFLGASAGSLAESATTENQTVTIVVIVVGIVFGVLAIWVTTQYAKKELARIVKEREANARQDEENDEKKTEQETESSTTNYGSL
jgi:uncharacterized membrane protein YdjX (TVP38/TMEM64 family)